MSSHKMEQSSALINILTYNLPGAITRPLFTEYNNRVKEIGDILGWEDSAYKELCEYESVIESLLAMSLFYRYVLGHFQAVTSFYKTVNQRCGSEKECAIKIGRIVLDKEQQNHLLGAVIAFGKIREKYNIFPAFFEFSETAQFLRNCKDLLTVKYYEDEEPV